MRVLAARIVDGALPPGARLDEAGLALAHGVSRTPVREALRELAAMGLVEHRPHRGAVVALPEPRRLAGMFELMGELEASAARFAAERMSPPQRSRLAQVHERSAIPMRASDPAGYEAANLAFHAAIFEGSDNPFLEETALTMRARIRPFSRGQFNLPGRLARSFAEHAEILTAIERGEAARAEASMRRHVMRIEHAARDWIERHDEAHALEQVPSADAERPAPPA